MNGKSRSARPISRDRRLQEEHAAGPIAGEWKGEDHSEITIPDSLPTRVAKAIRAGYCVIPQMRSKVSYFAWKEFQERRPSPQEVAKWCAKYPDANWAVVTGQVSGRIVLDFDGDEGRASLRKLGLQKTIKTPSGGYHVHVQAPEWRVQGGARIAPDLVPGMDLRADGQLATIYGSRSGKRYAWQKGWKLYTLEELPEALQQLLESRRFREPTPIILPEGFDTYTDGEKLIAEALSKVAEGEARNDTGFWLWCQLRDERYEFAAAQEAVERFAEKVNVSAGHSYTRQEVYNSGVSAYSLPARAPRAMREDKDDFWPRTDLGNAERLIARHGRDLRYCHPWSCWLVWDGQRWVRDLTAEVGRRAKDATRQIFRSAAEVDEPERTALIKFGRQTEAASRQRAMVDLARNDAQAVVLPEAFDADPWQLNVLNGVLDLRTGRLAQHAPENLLMHQAPVEYLPEVPCPQWEKFLHRVLPDEEDREYLKRAVGYSLCGSVQEHNFFIPYGTGRNGKGTFTGTIHRLLGSYGHAAPADLFLSQRPGGIREERADLFGKRFVVTTETEEGQKLAEAQIKALTGGDPISAHRKFEHHFTFMPTHKLWLATNYKPQIRGTDEGIWSRVHLVPFIVFIPERQRDLKLMEKLWDERSGILNWAMQGFMEWNSRGLAPSPNVRAASKEYREEEDTFGRFLDECCEQGAKLEELSSVLHSEHSSWAQKNNLKPMSSSAFGKKLSAKGFTSTTIGHAKTRAWRGIALRGVTVNVAKGE